jgi:lipopolysaccharide/colanic/teichoic acid biosynthesis glycosyltransferase
MGCFPIILDSRPSYLGESPGVSLLQMPCGHDTLYTLWQRRLASYTPYRMTVVRTFETDPSAYNTGLTTAAGGHAVETLTLAEFAARIATFEPSDAILLVEPSCFPLREIDLSAIFGDGTDSLRAAQHLVPLESTEAGTDERLEFNDDGNVRRVQRYYDQVTWTVAKGVTCSLLPASHLSKPSALPLDSLVTLRQALAARSVPSKDFTIGGRALDLSKPSGLIALNEWCVRAEDGSTRKPSAFDGEPLPESVRAVGPVVFHPNVRVEEDVVVIGPAVIGAGARLGRGAVVVQGVVAASATVPASAVVHHCVVTASPDLSESPVDAHDEGEVDALPLRLREDDVAPWIYPTIKRGLDIVVAAAALTALSPLLLLIAILIKLSSKGPVFYADRRESKNGRPFNCFKFRTMVVGAHAAQRTLSAGNQVDGPQFKMADDPRVTRLGRWLRRTNVDELPQLFNVLRGDMSLVGPRPSPFRENQTCVPWREARLSVRPGITGLWQVCRHDRELGDFHQWIHYDIEYVRNYGLLVDLKIVLATALVTVGGIRHLPLSWILAKP